MLADSCRSGYAKLSCLQGGTCRCAHAHIDILASHAVHPCQVRKSNHEQPVHYVFRTVLQELGLRTLFRHLAGWAPISSTSWCDKSRACSMSHTMPMTETNAANPCQMSCCRNHKLRCRRLCQRNPSWWLRPRTHLPMIGGLGTKASKTCRCSHCGYPLERTGSAALRRYGAAKKPQCE